jgi:hypothetical protein
VTWTKRVLKGERVQARVLNMPMSHVMFADRAEEYRRGAAEVTAQYLPDLQAYSFYQDPPSASFTPRGTITEVHHDSKHHISTAFRAASQKGRPLKLWLLWPSTEICHLARCYIDTNAALAGMD